MTRQQGILFGVVAITIGGILLVCGLLNAIEPDCASYSWGLSDCSFLGMPLADEYDDAVENIRTGLIAIGAVMALGGLGAVAWPWLVNSRAIEEYAANRARRERDD
jgi:hypothetical protein